MLQIEKKGTVRFWGDWFGRPHDNFHTVVKIKHSEEKCILHFDNGERCMIVEPVEIFSTKQEFHIVDAKEIIWEWYSYGKTQTRDNLMTIRYQRLDNKTITKYAGTKFEQINSAGFYAMEIL